MFTMIDLPNFIMKCIFVTYALVCFMYNYILVRVAPIFKKFFFVVKVYYTACMYVPIWVYNE
jgi:cell division protein FtsX